MPPAIREPTPRQLEILAFIKRYMALNRTAPTVREICAGFGLTNNAVMGFLRALQKKGAVQHLGVGRSRAYVPVSQPGRCPTCGHRLPPGDTR